jgi:opacity protein-like surface antigen
MKKSTVTVALLALGIFPVISHSATPQNNPSGPYVGLGWGQFNLDIENLKDVGYATSDIVEADDNAWKVFAGWRLNSYLSFEAAYIDFGAANGRFNGTGSNGNYEVDISGFSPSVIGTLPLGNFELFAKLGTYYYDVNIKVDLDNPGPNLDSSHSRNDLLYGAGVSYTFADHLNVRAEYETVKIENADSSDALWLSGAWRF